MATETDYVPSVSPANKDDAHIQRGTPELMCISPDSDNSPEQISGNSTLDLLRQQEWLLAKKQELDIQLLVRGQDKNEDIDKMSLEELNILHEKLNAEVVEKTCMKDSRELVLYGEHLKQLTMSVLFSGNTNKEENDERKNYRELEAIVEEFTELSNAVAEGYKENSEMRDELEILRKQNFELLKKSRQIYREIEGKKKEKEEELGALTTDGKGNSIHEKLQSKLRTNTYLRHILQALILGSGINWAEDEELQKQFLKAGRSVQI